MAQIGGTTGGEVLTGTPERDVIDGNGGTDDLIGLGGDDWFVVRDAFDRVFEDPSAGNDRVFAYVTWTLTAGSHVEILSTYNQTTTDAINLTGNALVQTIYGNAGNNALDGNGGGDVLIGEGGDDRFVIRDASDRAYEEAGEGNDRAFAYVDWVLNPGSHIEILSTYNQTATDAIDLTGNALVQTIYGNAGNNILDGNGGGDVMIGDRGDDWFVVRHAADRAYEEAGQGGDRVFAYVDWTLNAGSAVEIVGTYNQTATDAIDLTGNELSQTLFGNAGDNILDGFGGGDTMVGFGGDDFFVIRSASDLVLEDSGGGDDRVFAYVDWTLNAGAVVEIVGTYNQTATDDIDLTGNGFGQTLLGNAGNNILDGGGGVTSGDIMVGFEGDDWYVIRTGADLVFENAGAGADRVFAYVDWVLNAGSHVEVVGTYNPTATDAIDITGNELSQTILGNAGGNVLDGKGGADVLQGDAGADVFAFTSAFGGGNVDIILDFDAAVDRILLGGLADQPFAALGTGTLSSGAFRIGSAAADADDRILYDPGTGALRYDADGSGAIVAVQFATLSTGLDLDATSFIVSGPENRATTITSPTTASVAENSPTSTIVYQVVANDPDGDTIAYFLGGIDASAFTIDQNGAVRLVNPADFEVRQSYSFVVMASDSAGAGNAEFVTLNIVDVADGAQPPPAGATPVLAETSAANNSRGAAQAIDRGFLQPSNNASLLDDDLPSATIRGSISPNTDIDFYSISLNAGERLILDTDKTSGNLDVVIRIYDAGGNFLGYVDDSPVDPGSSEDYTGTTWDSFATFRASTSGTYYFSVESWGEGVEDGPGTGTTTGTYELNVSIGPAATAQQILDEDIDALINSAGWPDPDASRPGTNLTFAFPNSPSDYPAGIEETQNNFEPFNGVQQTATAQMLQQIANVADITFTRLFDPQESGATLRYAMSDEPEVAYAYLPGGSLGGTAWFRNSPIGERSTPSFDNPVPGGYAWMSILHETGHALGLKHGHEFPAISRDRDSVEYTVMTYRSYVGQVVDGYANETWGFPSTLMALDIAALQRMYGANFGFNAGDSVYSWNPASGQMSVNGVGGLVPGGNRVFMTVWDGGGNDTYDLSNYTSGVRIDLRPGEWTTTSQVQIANLGDGRSARGNVANAFLFEGDPRSLIENAIGGSGSDILIANQAANRLTGGGGADTFRWDNVENAGLGAGADTVTDFLKAADRLDLSNIDAVSGTPGNDSFAFIGAGAFTGVAGQLRYQAEGGGLRIQGDTDGNGIADLEIVLNNVTSLDATDFIF